MSFKNNVVKAAHSHLSLARGGNDSRCSPRSPHHVVSNISDCDTARCGGYSANRHRTAERVEQTQLEAEGQVEAKTDSLAEVPDARTVAGVQLCEVFVEAASKSFVSWRCARSRTLGGMTSRIDSPIIRSTNEGFSGGAEGSGVKGSGTSV